MTESSPPNPPATGFSQDAGFHPEALLPDQEELARVTFQLFLDGLGARLPGYFGVPAEARFAEIRQGRFADIVAAEAGACTALLEVNPVPGQACLVISRDLASAVLELLLGAPAGVAAEARESLTELDRHVLQGLIEVIAGELRNAWLPLCGASFRTVPSDRATGRVREELNAQSALEMRAEVKLRDRTGFLQLIVPSLLVRLAAEQAPASSPRSPVADALQSASFRLDAVLRGDGIRIRDLLRLKPGAVLQLPREAGTPLECQVNGIVKMRGGLVADGRSIAFQVQELHNAETEA